MDFAFCWEYKKCNNDCAVRERQVLFCWRAIRDVQSRNCEKCEVCEYRLRWVRGEFSIDAFEQNFDRRSARRTDKKVLVIDDDPNILFALEETVRFLGHECFSAHDGEEGLVMARGIRPDLIVTDVVMPKFDGFALCDFIKKDSRTSHIPVIIVTARDRKVDAEAGKAAGAAAFIVKPFRHEELSLCIEKSLATAEIVGPT